MYVRMAGAAVSRSWKKLFTRLIASARTVATCAFQRSPQAQEVANDLGFLVTLKRLGDGEDEPISLLQNDIMPNAARILNHIVDGADE